MLDANDLSKSELAEIIESLQQEIVGLQIQVHNQEPSNYSGFALESEAKTLRPMTFIGALLFAGLVPIAQGLLRFLYKAIYRKKK